MEKCAEKFEKWVRVCPNRSIFKRELIIGKIDDSLLKKLDAVPVEEFAMNEDEIDAIESAGFLRPRRDTAASSEMLWFFHPQLGEAIMLIQECRANILSFVRKRTFKEILERELFKAAGEAFFTVVDNPDNSSSGVSLGRKKGKKSSNSSVSVPLLARSQVMGLKYHLLDLCGSGLLLRKGGFGNSGDLLQLVP